MKSLAERITSLITPKNTDLLVSDTSSIDFVRTKKNILRELNMSKEHKTIVGVYCTAFGEGMFLTAVEDIEYLAKEEVIQFYPYDLSGKKLSRTRVQLNEIQMVCPFNKVYRNPTYYGKNRQLQNDALKTATVWL
ncbi:MAG TPA: hypothetical protein VF490_00770 [Chryseosolibacter sp.]